MKLKTATDQITEQIKHLIFNGKFMPGERLIEAKICEWLEVSRTPVREAYRKLEAEGLVQFLPNKGVYVTQVSIKDLEELYELRNILEIYCVRKFIASVSEENIKEMEALIKKMEALIKKEDYVLYFDLAIEFHYYIVYHCHNQLFNSIFSRIKNLIRSVQFLFTDDYNIYRLRSLEAHQEILKAIIEKDSEKCVKVLRKHLYNGYAVRIKILKKFDGLVKSQK